LSWIGKALLGFVHSVRAVLSFVGKALLGLISVAGVIVLVAFAAFSLAHYFWPVFLLGSFIALCSSATTGTNMKYDPKLVILVDDGSGRTAWVSLFTWYD
jgi:hypothetical protein